jgi:hypothetical protein
VIIFQPRFSVKGNYRKSINAIDAIGVSRAFPNFAYQASIP